MAVATLAPTLVGDAADILGRRPIYGLVLNLYIGVNIAIVLADSYAALVGLRVAQALAISGMKLSNWFKGLLKEGIDRKWLAPEFGEIKRGFVR